MAEDPEKSRREKLKYAQTIAQNPERYDQFLRGWAERVLQEAGASGKQTSLEFVEC